MHVLRIKRLLYKQFVVRNAAHTEAAQLAQMRAVLARQYCS